MPEHVVVIVNEEVPMAPEPSTANSLFAATSAAAGGGISWLLSTLYENGPSWSMVPALMFAFASVVGAIVAGLKAQQEYRHKNDWHQLKIETERKRLLAALSAEFKIREKTDEFVPPPS